MTSPSAFQKLILIKPKIVGINQFQSNITSSTKTAIIIKTISNSNNFPIFINLKLTINFASIPFVVYQ